MSFTYKKENSKSIKEKDSLQSAGDTFFDSLHNSKINEYTKNKIITTNKKENNFYLALKCMQYPNSDTIFLNTSEFSEINPNQTKDDNISKYLHHPIIKEINKEGNKLIRIKPKQNYETSINQPYTSKYNNMKNIFKDILISVKGIQDNENMNNKNINYFSNNINEIKFLHQKNNSSLTYNIKNYNNSNSNKNIIIGKRSNNTNINNKKNINISNRINSTTITKENKNNVGDIQDIRKQIKYDDNLDDLEESKDIDIKNYLINDEDKKNINFFLNDKNNNSSNSYLLKSNKNIIQKENGGEINNIKNIKNNSISTKKDEILVIDSYDENQNQNIKYIDKNENKTSTVKKLRKKYERTEFKKYIYNTNPNINRHLYENQDFNKEINKERNKDKRKKTEVSIIRNNKNKNSNIDYNYIIKHNINISTKNFSELEESLSQLSNNNNNINKNLLDNFNNCNNFKNNEFLTRYRNENNMNYNFKDIQYNNMFIESSNNSKSHYSIPPAELLDFISNKSENNLNDVTPNENENNCYNYNLNNTFIIKDIDNKLDIFSDNNNDNLGYELNRSAKSEYKINHIKNNLLLQDQMSKINISNSNENDYNNNNEYNGKDIYDFVTPEKNPQAIIRANFSLISSFYNENNNSIFNLNSKLIKCNSFSNKIHNIIYHKDFSLISDKSSNENNNNINTIKSRNIRFKRKNSYYLKENKDKIRESITHPQPETIYDLTFYNNLIENNSKIKKINFKNILKNQKKIKWEDRLHYLIWMMQICEEFAFKRDTFHYACNYFDYYLAFGKEKIKNKKILQLIGITCISISGKIEEVQIPKLKEYANSIDEIFDIKDIIEMEQKVCLSLGWKLINVNINTWLNWYTCQWDLYIDSVDDIKSQLLKYIKEEDIIYYKKSNDSSYYNYRKICQLIDIIVLDYLSYNYETRVLMAASLFIIICINYKLDYNFKKKNFRQKTAFSKYIFKVYNQFINQGFDYNFNDKNLQNALNYCYKFKNFNFTFDLPLLYQIHPEFLENGNYEDFISYQTTNEYLEEYLKDIIMKRNIKNSSEKTTNNTDKNKFSSYKKSNA